MFIKDTYTECGVAVPASTSWSCLSETNYMNRKCPEVYASYAISHCLIYRKYFLHATLKCGLICGGLFQSDTGIDLFLMMVLCVAVASLVAFLFNCQALFHDSFKMCCFAIKSWRVDWWTHCSVTVSGPQEPLWNVLRAAVHCGWRVTLQSGGRIKNKNNKMFWVLPPLAL